MSAVAPDAPIDLRLFPRSAVVDTDGHLHIGGCDVDALAPTFGTPLYVYDEQELRARAREYREAFGADAVSYAGKAFLCMAMVRLVADEGLHLDVATGGELHVAVRAGFPAARVVFHGNNKSDAELRAALELGVGRIVADSFDELDRLEALARGGSAPRVLVRVTPGVEAHTHEYIATGADDSKFGFTVANGAAREAALRVAKSDALDFAGFHCHIGSQILVLESFAVAAAIVAKLAAEVARATRPPSSARSTSAVGSASPTPPTTSTRRRSPSSPASCAPRTRRRVVTPVSIPRRSSPSKPGVRSRGRRGSRSTASARSRTSPGCAPTWRSTAA